MSTSMKVSIEFLTNPTDLPNLQLSSPSSSSNCSSSTEDVVNNGGRKNGEGKRRRQRSGPSCDHCRSRKVRCDAVIQILASNQLTEFDKRVFRDDSKIVGLDYRQNHIYKISDDWRIVKTKLDNSIYCRDEVKYIRYKVCKKCSTKDWNCQFSKGFTRMHSVPLSTNFNSYYTPDNITHTHKHKHTHTHTLTQTQDIETERDRENTHTL